MSTADLWPDSFGTESRLTPVSILQSQATALGEKTKHLVEGEVILEDGSNSFGYSLDLLAPALDDYRYRLLTIRHSIDLYPVSVTFKALNNLAYGPAQTEVEFEQILREILGHDRTVHIIQSLISQSKVFSRTARTWPVSRTESLECDT